ncbi:MAG: hypothetical protein PHR73_07265 [Candidatus Omnitrophica bacterium]|nr:hypothetical protein [Candidatus Omnitrophota bacterium]
MKILNIAIAGSILLLSGCSGYMIQSEKRSYVTEALSKSTYSVAFTGNAYMEQEEAEKLAMQRACEITLTKGYTHFDVLTKSDQSETNTIEDVPRYYSREPKATGSFVGPQNIVRPNITLTIECYKAKDAPKTAINAQEYIDKNFPGLKFKN